MSSHSAREGSLEPLDKGKRRAEIPTERTPLLLNGPSSQASSYYDETTSATPEVSTRRLQSRLTVVFLTSLALCVLLFVAAALLAWTYAARVSTASPEEIIQNSLVFHGPNSVDIINITSTRGVWVKVEASVGVDAGSFIGVNSDPEKDSFLRGLWKSFGRWWIGRLEQVTVSFSSIDIVSDALDPPISLASVEVQPITMPFTANPSREGSWLKPISMILIIRPTNVTNALSRFMQKSWQQGSIVIKAEAGRVSIQGGSLDEKSWKSKLHGEFSDVQTLLRMKIPRLPGLPQPGDNTPFPSIEDLVTLTSLDISSETNRLTLQASATVIDPAPTDFNMTTPFIPFIVSLPSTSDPTSSVPVAFISTAPFTLTHPNITLDIFGHALPLATESVATLSSFLTRYLSGKSNPIFISSPLVSGLSIETRFPAPNPRPQILRGVTIRNMKIKPGSPFLASGIVSARVVLPKGININLNVSRLLPDVLIYDGEVPDSDPATVPPPTPLPDPLPPRAFGHIRPDDWLPASCIPDVPEKGNGAAFNVTANFVDVPLEVLPGRQKEFSDFVSKVVFSSGGAVAGIQGVAAVSIKIHGLPYPGSEDGEMELSGLPVKGSVRVGKRALFSLEMLRERLDRVGSEGTEELWTLF